MFQRRFDGSVNFYRDWDDYKHGFGDINSDYWIGLDNLNKLTSTENTNWRLEVSKSYFQGSIERIVVLRNTSSLYERSKQ